MANKYITFISSQNYLLAALTLHKSLKQVNSQYPLVIAITDQVATNEVINILIAEQVDEYIIIPTLKYQENNSRLKNFISDKPSLWNTASKLALFNLEWDDKLVYLDADMLVIENIDDIFDYPNGAILTTPTEKLGLSGMFVFIPKYHDYRIYKCLLDNLDGALDGMIIGLTFFSARENSDFQISDKKYFTEDLFLQETGKVYHCHGHEKPFLMTPQELLNKMCFPAYQEYCKIYLPLRIKYPDI